MKRMLDLGMFAVLAVAVTPCAGQESHRVSHGPSADFASMQAELAALRAEIREVSLGGGATQCDTCGGCDCYCNIGCGGWYGGADAVIVKAHSEAGAFSEAGDRGPGDPVFDYEVSPRVWLGYRNCAGRGLRVRYWNFDHDSRVIIDGPINAPPEDVEFTSLDVHAIDLEATQLVCWGPLQVNVSGGARYGKVDALFVDIDTADNDVQATATDFEGFGPTVALEARRPVGCSGLALVGNTRASLLFGDAKGFFADVSFAGGGTQFLNSDDYSHEDNLAYILESQVGAEYSRCFHNGVLAIRALMEAQLWLDTTNEASFDFTERQGPGSDLGFFGVTVGVEYSH